jgi:predicted nucleic acid-binding protein
MTTNVLVDANFLIALSYPYDKYHAKAVQFALQNQSTLLIADVVLPEVMYNLKRVGGLPAVTNFANNLALAPPFIPLLPTDFQRAMHIMVQYAQAHLDFVEWCLTAIAERLNITHICTFDRRDFSMIRPKHTDYFILLP